MFKGLSVIASACCPTSFIGLGTIATDCLPIPEMTKLLFQLGRRSLLRTASARSGTKGRRDWSSTGPGGGRIGNGRARRHAAVFLSHRAVLHAAIERSQPERRRHSFAALKSACRIGGIRSLIERA
jgi:hypothetical protein